MAGTALFHALGHNHPFHNRNKRTALVALVSILDANGYLLRRTEDELYDYVLALSVHAVLKERSADRIDSDERVLAVAKWLRLHAHRVSKREQVLKFRELPSILHRHGCEIERAAGSSVRIRRGGLVTQIHYDDQGREVQPGTLQKIRRDLELDEGHGCDSDSFYSAESRIDGFIMTYREALNRLARA